MSLLIKALDKAMTDKASTDKAAQQNKQGDSQPLELSLESITPAAAETTPEISLEEEAGLSATPSKYAKSKTVASIKSAKSAALEKATATQTGLQQNKSASIGNSSALNKSFFTDTSQTSADVASVQNSLPPVFQAMLTQTDNVNQKAAAKVFVANQQVKTNSSKLALALLSLAGALVIWLAIQGYGYIKTLMMPEVVVVKPTISVTAQDVNTMNSENTKEELPVNLQADNEPLVAEVATVAEQKTPNTDRLNTEKSGDLAQSPAPIAAIESEATVKPSANDAQIAKAEQAINAYMAEETQKKSRQTVKNEVAMQITSKTPVNGIDPNLSAAYAAFNRGDNTLAQQKYRLVLQGDVRNTDALLGMAAIAQRQGRDADAVGWYQKVLEIEPRNSIAQSAMVNIQTNTDSIGRESRLKNMIAQQPEAHLYAALGNGYAEQNQWPAAQEAYFNASRLAPNNADYAFNLAISLEQLGKSNLALAQYERALDLMNKSGANSPNRAVLEARIQALQ